MRVAISAPSTVTPCVPSVIGLPRLPGTGWRQLPLARAAAYADRNMLADLGWTRAIGTPSVVGFLSGDAMSAGTLASLFDGLCSGLGGRLVGRADVVSPGRSSSVQTIAWAGQGRGANYGLVDLTLNCRSGRRTLRTQDTGIGWSLHAVERRYERTSCDGFAGVAIAREIVPQRTMLRLAVREARRMGLKSVSVPVAGGMLLGTAKARDAVPPCASVCVKVHDGAPVRLPVTGSGIAADGNHWTGVTYVDRAMLREDQVLYAEVWDDVSRDPGVAYLSGVSDWNAIGGEAGCPAFAEAVGRVRDRLRTLLLLADIPHDVAGDDEDEDGED